MGVWLVFSHLVLIASFGNRSYSPVAAQSYGISTLLRPLLPGGAMNCTQDPQGWIMWLVRTHLSRALL